MTGTPLLFALCAAAHGRYPPPHREAETGRGLAGALLIQGALAGRLQLDDNRVRSTGHGRTDDPVLEEALDRLGPSARGRAPADWVERLGPWALTRLHPGPTLPPGGVGARPDPADPRPREALRRVREAVQGRPMPVWRPWRQRPCWPPPDCTPWPGRSGPRPRPPVVPPGPSPGSGRPGRRSSGPPRRRSPTPAAPRPRPWPFPARGFREKEINFSEVPLVRACWNVFV